MINEEAISVLSANVMFTCDRALFDIATKRCVEDALDKAIDALEEQKMGKWLKYEGWFDFKCSECECYVYEQTAYCPHCGARMEVE